MLKNYTNITLIIVKIITPVSKMALFNKSKDSYDNGYHNFFRNLGEVSKVFYNQQMQTLFTFVNFSKIRKLSMLTFWGFCKNGVTEQVNFFSWFTSAFQIFAF